MNLEDFRLRRRRRRRAAVVREIPLEAVLHVRGAVRDKRDKRRWHTEQGPVSVRGAQFMSWHHDHGAGGAIDLVMHLAGIDFDAAVTWLEQHLGVGYVPASDAASDSPCRLRRGRRKTALSGPEEAKLRLPRRNDQMMHRVGHYLTQQRRLAPALVEGLMESGRLYADGRANGVFVMVAGKANRPIGAELRGTGSAVWRGMAPGTRKDLGYFWIGVKGCKRIVLCESAIDAISCLMVHPGCICLSTAGARANPPWLAEMIARGYTVSCGFDADEPGDAMAAQMIALYPAVARLRPPAHDWNDVVVQGTGSGPRW